MKNEKTVAAKSTIRHDMVAVADDYARDLGLMQWAEPGNFIVVIAAEIIYYGEVVAITPAAICLTNASWIPDTGRRSDFIRDPQTGAKEVEFIGDVMLERPVIAYERPLTQGVLNTR